MMNRMKKVVLWFAAILLAVLGLVVAYAFAFYPAEYTLRVLRWGNSDVYDYQKFPERTFTASSEPYQFEYALQETAVANKFSSHPIVNGDFEAFLAKTGTQAFIVIHNDTILYEKYFNGASQSSIVTSFSMAKSFTSALVGIAIAEGHIHSVDDPITDYLPELAQRDARFTNITIRDLLLMSSGIRYEEFPFVNGDDAKTYYYPDLSSLALNETEIVGIPGESFLYNNYHPLLLGLILERATGQPVADYLANKLWQPMGAAYAGSWSLDEQGFEKMESGINGRAIDFAKFGTLFLHQGEWNGKQIVPAAWVQESTEAALEIPATYYPEWYQEPVPNGYYKYMWWGLQRDGQADDFSAIGNHGQYIYISPTKQLVIVRHGEAFGTEMFDWPKLFFDFATEIDTLDQG